MAPSEISPRHVHNLLVNDNMNLILKLTGITRLLLFPLLFSFASSALAGVYPYAEFKDTIVPKVLEILKKHGMPVALDREDPWFGISGVPGNYTIGLHQSEEIPQQAVVDIVKQCMDFYEQRGRKETFHIMVYRESKEQWRKSLFLGIGYFAGVKPYFELTLEGEKQ